MSAQGYHAERKTLKVCSCNRTIAIDAAALGAALKTGAPLSLHHQLCRKERARLQAALGEADDIVVGCTQEAPLFGELAAASSAASTAGCASSTSASRGLVGRGGRPRPEDSGAARAGGAARTRSRCRAWAIKSGGSLLIIGPAEAALAWAERVCAAQLAVSVLVTAATGGELPHERASRCGPGKCHALSGLARRVRGRVAAGQPDRPRPVHALQCLHPRLSREARSTSATRSTSTMQGAPQCVTACGAIGAIDFAAPRQRREGALRPGARSVARAAAAHARAAAGLSRARATIRSSRRSRRRSSRAGRANSRSRAFSPTRRRSARTAARAAAGCNQCIDVCSTGAIRADGDHVRVEPHLCMGCGGCATVCPSGAMSYAYPDVAELGTRLKTAAVDLPRRGRTRRLHPVPRRARGARRWSTRWAAADKGLPARVIPVDAATCASIGIDSDARRARLRREPGRRARDREAPRRRSTAALERQMALSPRRSCRPGLSGGISSCCRRRSRPWNAGVGAAAGAPCEGRRLQLVDRQAHHARLRDRAPCRRTRQAADEITLPRVLRSARSRSTRKRAPCAWPASAPAPKAALLDSAETPSCASSSETACSAACAQTPAPRTRSRSCRACCSRPRRSSRDC